MKDFDPTKHLIFEGITGSKLYGTDTPDSDVDRRGVCIPTREVLLNPFMPFEQKDSGFEEEDRVIYALGKFFALCADCNPNIVEMLFIPRKMMFLNTLAWEKIIKHRDLFLSKKAKYTFTGYAFSQLNAIKTHRQWFINPPERKPERKDFGLKEVPLVTGDNLTNLLSIPTHLFKDEYLQEVANEREYRLQKKKWDNYVAWRDNRNPKRREMEDKFGYDCKHASHLIRLMTEGKELLLTGNITFPLENAQEIRAIKNGKYSYDEILEIAETMDNDFETWYEDSTLPKAPDRNGLMELYLEILR